MSRIIPALSLILTAGLFACAEERPAPFAPAYTADTIMETELRSIRTLRVDHYETYSDLLVDLDYDTEAASLALLFKLQWPYTVDMGTELWHPDVWYGLDCATVDSVEDFERCVLDLHGLDVDNPTHHDWMAVYTAGWAQDRSLARTTGEDTVCVCRQRPSEVGLDELSEEKVWVKLSAGVEFVGGVTEQDFKDMKISVATEGEWFYFKTSQCIEETRYIGTQCAEGWFNNYCSRELCKAETEKINHTKSLIIEIWQNGQLLGSKGDCEGLEAINDLLLLEQVCNPDDEVIQPPEISEL